MAMVTMVKCEVCGTLTESTSRRAGWISIDRTAGNIEIEFEQEEGSSFVKVGRLDFCGVNCFSEWLHDLPLTE